MFHTKKTSVLQESTVVCTYRFLTFAGSFNEVYMKCQRKESNLLLKAVGFCFQNGATFLLLSDSFNVLYMNSQWSDYTVLTTFTLYILVERE